MKPNCTEKAQFSNSMHPFSDIPSFSKILNPQVRTWKLVNSVFYHPCPLILASQGYNFLFLFKLLRVLPLRMLVEFSLTYIFQHVWETVFHLWCSHSQKIIESMLFYSCPSLPLETPGRIFWKSVSPETEGIGGSYDLLCQNSVRKDEDDFEH